MLSDSKVKSLKSSEKPYVILDGDGLYVQVQPNGSKYWIVRLSKNGKETRRSLGSYPQISIRDARAKRDEIKNLLDQAGSLLVAKHIQSGNFREIAEEWLKTHVISSRSKGHADRLFFRLKNYVFPHIGEMRMEEISSPMILGLLRPIENAGKRDTTHRVKGVISQVFRFAIATGRAEIDPSMALRGALAPTISKHYATIISPEGIRGLMQAIDAINGSVMVKNALLLSAYLFPRPGELRKMEWKEIDIGNAEWLIPATKMKMKRPHIVPLSNIT